MHPFRFLLIVVIVAVAVAVLAVAFPTPADAQGKYCSPWPGCKDQGSGDPPGLSTCNIEFGLAPNTCMAVDDDGIPIVDGNGTPVECGLVRPKDGDYAWIFIGNCQTFAALVLGMESPTSAGTINQVLLGDGYTLHLVANPDASKPVWSGGRAAITNLGGTTRVADLNIEVDDPRVADCDSGSPVQAAISLHGASSIPMMAAAKLTVSTGPSAQFCNVIERVSGIKGGGVTENVIGVGSFSNAAIFVTGVSGNVSIFDNNVGYSADGCVGIQVGPSADANIDRNYVREPGCNGTDGVGIRVEGIAANEIVSLVRNSVDTLNGSLNSVAAIDILNSTIEKNQGNSITGDPLDRPYRTLSSTVPFPLNGRKKNTCNGSTIFDDSSLC